MVDKQEQEAFKVNDDSPHPCFVEVICKSSGKARRFAPGTHASFALNLINNKLLLEYSSYNTTSSSSPLLASHIEAVKLGHDSEEPISFGPTATLLDYGPPWILQTVVDTHSPSTPLGNEKSVHKPTRHSPSVKGSEGHRSAKKTSQPLGLLYIGKILLAFLIIFAIGATFTLVLENLPTLLLYMNSNM